MKLFTKYYFPTVIGSKIDLDIVEKMLPVVKKYLSDPNLDSKTWGYKTTFNPGPGIAVCEDIQPFIEYVEQEGREFLVQSGYNPELMKFKYQIFASEMIENDFHAQHAHPNSLLSGILYLETPPGSAPIMFTDPRPHRQFVSMPKMGDAESNWDEVVYTPEPGLFLIWESWLMHGVPKNYSKEGRITLVFNMIRIEE
jgi:hypothetical protein